MQKFSLTISASNDAPELNVFAEFDRTSGFDPAGEQISSGQLPEKSNLAQEVVAASQVNGGRQMLNPGKIKKSLDFLSIATPNSAI